MDDQVSSAADDRLRDEIAAMLKDGLKTEIWPRAETSAMVNDIVLRLHNEANDDLDEKTGDRRIFGLYGRDGGYRAALRNLYVLSRAPQILRLAGIEPAGGAGMVLPALAHMS